MSTKEWMALKNVQNGSLKATGRSWRSIKANRGTSVLCGLKKVYYLVVSVCHSFVTELTENYNYVMNKDMNI